MALFLFFFFSKYFCSNGSYIFLDHLFGSNDIIRGVVRLVMRSIFMRVFIKFKLNYCTM